MIARDDQREHRDQAERAVVEQQVQHDQAQADEAGEDACLQLVVAHRRRHRGDVDRLEGDREGAVLQHVGEVLGLLRGEVALDLRLSAEDRLVESRRRDHDAVEHDGERVTGVGAGAAALGQLR